MPEMPALDWTGLLAEVAREGKLRGGWLFVLDLDEAGGSR